MAYVSKEGFLSLWEKFKNNPNSLSLDDYKTLAGSAIELSKSGEISSDLAQTVIKALDGRGS